MWSAGGARRDAGERAEGARLRRRGGRGAGGAPSGRAAGRGGRSCTSASGRRRCAPTRRRSTWCRRVTETYERPGALPDVRPGASIEEDLERRDFTVNAIAFHLADGALTAGRRPRGPGGQAAAGAPRRAPSRTTRRGCCAWPATPRASGSSPNPTPTRWPRRRRVGHGQRRAAGLGAAAAPARAPAGGAAGSWERHDLGARCRAPGLLGRRGDDGTRHRHVPAGRPRGPGGAGGAAWPGARTPPPQERLDALEFDATSRGIVVKAAEGAHLLCDALGEEVLDDAELWRLLHSQDARGRRGGGRDESPAAPRRPTRATGSATSARGGSPSPATTSSPPGLTGPRWATHSRPRSSRCSRGEAGGRELQVAAGLDAVRPS